MERIYIGEAGTILIDLAASLSDADYDLTGRTMIFRVLPPGATAAVLEVDAIASLPNAGEARIDYTAAESALLSEGEVVGFLLDTTDSGEPRVLFTAWYLAAPLPEEVDADAEATESPLSRAYSSYLAAGGGSVPEDEWRRYNASAARVVSDVTFRNAEEATDADLIARVSEAIYRTADALYFADTGVQSEKLGGYSVTYSGQFTRSDASRVAQAALAGTGLTYSGLAWSL